jgi:Kef-type K+ transport system membrane component KefB
LVAAASLPLGYVISRALGVGPFATFAVLLAGSSAAVAFPIIEERGLKGPAVSILVAWVAIADSLTVVLLSLTLSGPRQVVPAVLGDAAIIGAAVVIYAVARRLVFTPTAQSAWKVSRERGWALQLRLSLLLLLVLGTIADRTGASTLVAGFMAGIVLQRLHQPNRLEIQFIGVANGFFVPIFFVLLGARVDLRSLGAAPSAIGVALAMVVGAVAVHVLGALLSGKEKRVASGLAASAQLGLPAAAASLGLASHVLTPALAAALVAAGCLTLVPASVGAALLAKGSGQA